MGGEGSMSSAIITLRQNRALLKKRKYKGIKELVYDSSGKTELEFKRISASEMAAIKNKIRNELKKSARMEVYISIVSIIVALGLIYFLYWWIAY